MILLADAIEKELESTSKDFIVKIKSPELTSQILNFIKRRDGVTLGDIHRKFRKYTLDVRKDVINKLSSENKIIKSSNRYYYINN